jgi:hypothetical protein
MKVLKTILDWSEVWALLIPLAVLVFKRKQPAILKPVIVYVWAAFIINLFIDLIWKYFRHLDVSLFLKSNNYLYNFHSIIRLLLFSWFFIQLKQPYLATLKKMIPFVFLAFVVINFFVPSGFRQNFFEFAFLSSRLLSIEAAFLLFYCIQYYLFKLKDQNDSLIMGSVFWVVTGLCTYAVINFFIFFYYAALSKAPTKFASDIWYVHNVSFIILCIFIAKAFYDRE